MRRERLRSNSASISNTSGADGHGKILSVRVRTDIHRDRGRRFADTRMAENYRYRPPYPAEVYETLLELLDGHPRIVLDAGCGTGKIVLRLIDQIDSADAVDPSEAMLRVAQSTPGAGNPKIRWIHSTIEVVGGAPRRESIGSIRRHDGIDPEPVCARQDADVQHSDANRMGPNPVGLRERFTYRV